MTDFAVLAMRVDATGMLPGDQALDRLALKGAQADAQVTKATTSMSKGMSKVGAAAGVQANGLRTLGMQIGQITQQTAAGANVINAVGMQLGDILPMLGIGGLAGVAATAVGIMAPLAATLLTTGDSAKDAADKIDELKDAQDALNHSMDIATMPLNELVKKYGDAAARVREMTMLQMQLNVAVARGTLAETITGLSTATDQYTRTSANFWSQTERVLGAVEEDFGLTGDAAWGLIERLRALDDATGRDLQLEKFKDLVEFLTAAGIKIEDMPPEMAKAAAAMLDVNIKAEELEAMIGNAVDKTVEAEGATWGWANAMGDVRAEMELITSLLGSIGGTMITNAKISAAKAVRDAGGSAAEARRAGELAGKRQEIINGQSTVGSEYYGMSDAMIQTALGQADQESAQAAEWSRLTTADPKAKKAAGAKKNSYEKDVFTIQKETESLLAQADAIARVVSAGGDWERALRVIETEQELLTEAQRAGLKVTPELKDKIHELAEANVDAKEKLGDLRDATENGQDAFRDLFGSIIDGSGSAKDAIINLLAEIAKVQFTKGMMGLLNQTSWGGGLISAIGGLLSYDGGGYTGDGARVGGIDGKGGSLAVVHPQETIIDHTKGQSTAGYGIEMTSSQLTLTDDGKLMTTVDAKIVRSSKATVGQSVQATGRAMSRTKAFGNR